MSTSAVNMCRFVIVVIFALFASYALAEETPQKNATTLLRECLENQGFNDSKTVLKTCFNETVEQHLHPSSTPKPGCQNTSDLFKKLDAHMNLFTKCNLTSNTTILKSLIDFSLQNETFKNFMTNFEFLKIIEFNVSSCVKNNVGHFNVTKDKTHAHWVARANLNFSDSTCKTSLNVRNCVDVPVLRDCGPDARKYVVSLFNHVRALGDCGRFNTTGLPLVTEAKKTSWFTTPVKITFGVGAAVVGIAVIIVLVLKCKHKQ